MSGKMKRRSFLGLLGVAPLAAKATAEAEVTKLMGVHNFAGGSFGAPAGTSGLALADQNFRLSAIRAALMTPDMRRKAESLIFAKHQHVIYFDHDIANKKSFSLAAKIVFQRQRNVEREIEFDWLGNSPWEATRKWFDKLWNPLS